MKTPMHPDMAEATRLTREGRLIEATALIQRILRGGKKPDASSETSSSATVRSLPRKSDVIAVTPEPIEAHARRLSPEARAVDTSSLETHVRNTGATARPVNSGGMRGIIEKFAEMRLALPGGNRKSGPAPTDAHAMVSRTGQFTSATFTVQAGSRAYKLYIPSGYLGKPLPLVIMLHGCTQSADDFATGTRMNLVAEERSCFVAYPAQPTSANGSKCWNWFDARHQQRDRGEPALIAGLTRQIMRDYAIDPRRVYVAGLSAGGAAAAIMAATYPDLYAAAGVHSGLPCGAASDLGSAFSAMQRGTSAPAKLPHRSTGLHGRDRLVPTIVFHGDKDVTVHPQNGHRVIEQSRPIGSGEFRSITQRGHVPGGRTYSRTNHVDASGRTVLEMWVVHGAGHAWSGGSQDGTYTDHRGPDASREMMRFFLEHSHPAPKLV